MTIVILNFDKLIELDDIMYIIRLFFMGFLAISLASHSYNCSEIKHLSDGISNSQVSNKFYLQYYMMGIILIILELAMTIVYDFSIINYIIIFFFWIVFFILGMGDALQVRDINKCNGIKGNLRETFFIFIDLPINIIKVIFIHSNGLAFIDKLKFNLEYIWKGGLTAKKNAF